MTNEIKTSVTAMIMMSASYFLAGTLILNIIINTDINTFGWKEWLTLIVGGLICLFGFIIAIFAIPTNSKRLKFKKWADKVNVFARSNYYIIFISVIFQLLKYSLDTNSVDIIRVLSVIFLVFFLLIFLITIITKSGLFNNSESIILFIIMISIFSIIWMLITELNIWGGILLFTIILFSALRLYSLSKRNK